MRMDRCKCSDVIVTHSRPEEDGEKLNDTEAKMSISLAARCNFLAADPIDMQLGCKQICRNMSEPCEGDWEMLKKAARCRRYHPRMAMICDYQEPVRRLKVIVDTDDGGCKRTGRSTMVGWRCWEHTWASAGRQPRR